jgi:pimeloyl-ACP methyl ester carboxylesterase
MSHPFKSVPANTFNILHASSPSSPPAPPVDIQKALATLPKPRKHYKYYFSTPEAGPEMNSPNTASGIANMKTFLQGYLHLKSGDWSGNSNPPPFPLKKWSADELAKMPEYYIMPLKSGMQETVAMAMSHVHPKEIHVGSPGADSWLGQQDLEVYATEWARTGFQGGLNWYRVATNPVYLRDMAIWAGKKIEVPMLFIAGERDWGMYQEPGVVEKMHECCTRFKGVKIIPGAGHWVQQERAEEVVKLILDFMTELKSGIGEKL